MLEHLAICHENYSRNKEDETHYLTTAQLIQILEEEYGISSHRQTIKSEIELLEKFGLEIEEVKSTQNRYNAQKEKELRHNAEAYVVTPLHLVWNGDCYYMVGVHNEKDDVQQ